MKTPRSRSDALDLESTQDVSMGDELPKAHELIDLYDLLDYYSVHEKNRGGNWDFDSKPSSRFDLRPN